MPSMENFITGHNRKTLTGHANNNQDVKNCNCRDKSKCPLEGRCLSQSIVYKATITQPSTRESHTYFGATEPPFKYRLRNHEQSFKKKSKAHDTHLAKHIWQLKNEGKEFQVKWEVQKQCQPYKCGARRCDLCLSEKYEILRGSHDRTLLNKRSEIMNFCRHRTKFKLKQCNL